MPDGVSSRTAGETMSPSDVGRKPRGGDGSGELDTPWRRLDPTQRGLRTLHLLLQYIIIPCGAGFLLGRAIVLGGLHPFGRAFVVCLAAFGHRGRALLAALGVLWAALTSLPGSPIDSPTAILVFVWLFAAIVGRIFDLAPWASASGAMLGAGTLGVVAASFGGDPIFSAAAAGIADLTATWVFLPVVHRLFGSVGRRLRDGGYVASVLVFVGLMVMGTTGLEWAGYSIHAVAVRVFALVGALVGGVPGGTVAGTVLGLLTLLADASALREAVTVSMIGLGAGLGVGLFRAALGRRIHGSASSHRANVPAGGTPGGMSAGIPDGMSAGMPGGMSAGMPDGMSAGMPGGMSAGTSRGIPEPVAARLGAIVGMFVVHLLLSSLAPDAENIRDGLSYGVLASAVAVFVPEGWVRRWKVRFRALEDDAVARSGRSDSTPTWKGQLLQLSATFEQAAAALAGDFDEGAVVGAETEPGTGTDPKSGSFKGLGFEGGVPGDPGGGLRGESARGVDAGGMGGAGEGPRGVSFRTAGTRGKGMGGAGRRGAGAQGKGTEGAGRRGADGQGKGTEGAGRRELHARANDEPLNDGRGGADAGRGAMEDAGFGTAAGKIGGGPGSGPGRAMSGGTPLESRDGFEQFVKDVRRRVCLGCSHEMVCWETYGWHSYRDLLAFVTEMPFDEGPFDEDSGTKLEVDPARLPSGLRQRCIQLQHFALGVEKLLALVHDRARHERQMNRWQAPLQRQLNGLAEIIASVAAEISRVEEEEIRMEIDDGWEAVNDTGPAGVATSRVAGTRSHPTFQVLADHVHVPGDASIVSGDFFQQVRLPGERVAFIVCDGMGSGARAAAESRAVAAMLSRFLSVGFDLRFCVQTINAVMLLRAAADSFVTVDVSVVHLNDGTLHMAKTGAAPTYIHRGDDVEMVRADSLPVGILPAVDVYETRRQLNLGDVVVMMSDGALELGAARGDKGELARRHMRRLTRPRPKQMVDSLFSRARHVPGEPLPDDVTIVAVQLMPAVIE